MPEEDNGGRDTANLGLHTASNCVSLAQQVSTLFILAIPVACVAWTLTHEAIIREVREYCKTQSETAGSVFKRKFFYVFTCEYCLSHYVTAVILAITRFKLVFGDWRGYLISLFSLVWIANQYMSIYDRLRLEIKHEHISINAQQQQSKSQQVGSQQVESSEQQPKNVA
jgi:uncharacterized membrane protein YccF (DUF307 family)